MRLTAKLAVVALLAQASLSACGSQSDEAAAASGAPARAALSGDAAKLASYMVSAVSAGGGRSSVDVKFELAQRPEVGKSVDISLVFIPVSPLDRLSARFAVADGLELLKGEETEQFARPVVGAPITHTLTILPKRDGIFSVQATVLTDSESDSVSRVYSIPLIAGSGIAEWSPQKVASRGDDPR